MANLGDRECPPYADGTVVCLSVENTFPTEPPMPTIEQLIEALLPLLPDAEITLDNDGQVVIRTGLTAPPNPRVWV